MSKVKIFDEWDALELAATICEQEDAEDYDKVSEALYEKFGVDVDTFHAVAKVLFNMIHISCSPLTGEVYKGFAKADMNYWPVKTSAKNEFIGSMINWLQDGDDSLSQQGNTTKVEKIISVNGNPKYVVSIRKYNVKEVAS